MVTKPLNNERELLAQIAAGDERAFTQVFHWYVKPLGHIVLKLTESLEVTEEIIQDSFIKIWNRRETLPSIDNFGAYLYVLCRNHAFLVMKKMASEEVSMATVEQNIKLESEAMSYDNPAEHYRTLIDAAVERLPAQQQKVYKLSRYDRLKYEEIGRKLNISSETVKKHIQAAIKSIQQDVKGQMSIIAFLVLTTPIVLR